jgi:hypothetical protein
MGFRSRNHLDVGNPVLVERVPITKTSESQFFVETLEVMLGGNMNRLPRVQLSADPHSFLHQDNAEPSATQVSANNDSPNRRLGETAPGRDDPQIRRELPPFIPSQQVMGILISSVGIVVRTSLFDDEHRLP